MMLIRGLAVAVIVSLAVIAHAAAQEPTPQPTPEWPRCLEGPGQPGGRTIETAGRIQITIPAGSYQELVIPPHSGQFHICHVETQALVTISISTCKEVSRRTASPEANAVADQIVSSCKLPPDRPPEPHCPGGYVAYPVEGPRTLVSEAVGVQVALAPGRFMVEEADDPRQVTICKLQANGVSMNYSLTLAADSCERLHASWLNEEARLAVDAVAASCRVVSGLAPPVATGAGLIRPPDTGDAGLKLD